MWLGAVDGSMREPSRKAFSFRDREGCRRLRRAGRRVDGLRGHDLLGEWPRGSIDFQERRLLPGF